MVFRIGWFSTGRDEAARDLLEVVASHIEKGTIPGKISFVFCNRERGESEESDRFIEQVEGLGIPLVLFSSARFSPPLRRRNREAWRESYHQAVASRIQGRAVEVIVLAGYMLIVGGIKLQPPWRNGVTRIAKKTTNTLAGVPSHHFRFFS